MLFVTCCTQSISHIIVCTCIPYKAQNTIIRDTRHRYYKYTTYTMSLPVGYTATLAYYTDTYLSGLYLLGYTISTTTKQNILTSCITNQRKRECFITLYEAVYIITVISGYVLNLHATQVVYNNLIAQGGYIPRLIVNL